ncbi:MAG: AI-2E family transporter [Nitrospirae bacterium]|nr:AI-2E family transporter [Candidatus Manganitrophaceae bacterium]
MTETRREARWGWLTILLLGIGLVYLAKSVLIPFVIALLLAYAFDPVVGYLERRRVPRFVAIWTILAVIVGLFVLFLLVVIPVIQSELTRALEELPVYLERVQKELVPYLEGRFGFHIPNTFEEMSAVIVPRLKEQAPSIFEPVTAILLSFFSNTAHLLFAIANLIVIPFAFYYFLKDFDRLKQRIGEYIPPRHRPEVHRWLHELDQSLSGFIRGQLLIVLILAGAYSAGLTLIGVELAFVLGIIAAFGEIVPYVGFTVGLSLSVLVAFLQFQDLLHPFYVLLLFAAIQSVQGLVVAPLVMGQQVGLHPLVVIAAVYIGGDLFGFIGILLAVPGAAVMVVLFKALTERYRKSVLYRT